jgi:proteic killer suppression protein
MIRSFRDRESEEIFLGLSSKRTRRFPPAVVKMAKRRMDWLHAATTLDDIANSPGADLHKLTGDLSGYCAIRVNDQFRLIFQWRDSGVHVLGLVDYH